MPLEDTNFLKKTAFHTTVEKLPNSLKFSESFRTLDQSKSVTEKLNLLDLLWASTPKTTEINKIAAYSRSKPNYNNTRRFQSQNSTYPLLQDDQILDQILDKISDQILDRISLEAHRVIKVRLKIIRIKIISTTKNNVMQKQDKFKDKWNSRTTVGSNHKPTNRNYPFR